MRDGGDVHISPDGLWRWDAGVGEWVARPPAVQVSPDGCWWWDASAEQWRATDSSRAAVRQRPAGIDRPGLSRLVVPLAVVVALLVGVRFIMGFDVSIAPDQSSANRDPAQSEVVVQPTCSAPRPSQATGRRLEVRGCLADYQGGGARVVISHHVGNVEFFSRSLVGVATLANLAGMACVMLDDECFVRIFLGDSPVATSLVRADGTYRISIPSKSELRGGDLNVNVFIPGSRLSASGLVEVARRRGSYEVPPIVDWRPDPTATLDGHLGSVDYTPFPETGPAPFFSASREGDEPVGLIWDHNGNFIRSALPSGRLQLHLRYHAANGISYSVDAGSVPAIPRPISAGRACFVDTGDRLINFRPSLQLNFGHGNTCGWTDESIYFPLDLSHEDSWRHVCRELGRVRCDWGVNLPRIPRLVDAAVVDLGSVQPVSEVIVNAPQPRPATAVLEVSDDGLHWRMVGPIAGRGLSDPTAVFRVAGLVDVTARYVRISGLRLGLIEEITVY